MQFLVPKMRFLRRRQVVQTFQYLFNRHRQRAFPEFIEVGGHIQNSGSQEQDIPITKVILLIEIEIFVSHVAAAGNAGQAVKYRSLVMHALVGFAEIKD